MPTVTMNQEGAFCTLKPTGYLGGDLFAAYRAAIEGATYDPKSRKNVASLDKVPTMLKRLREAGFDVEITDELGKSLQDHTAQQWLDLQGAKERADVVDAELRANGKALYPFQRVGTNWLALRFGALLADEMGLGKTIQAICALPANARAIVVAPAVAKGVWRRELRRFRPRLNVEVIDGRGNFRYPEPGEVIVLNYDILPDGHQTTLKVVKNRKNPKAVRTCDKACPGCAPFLKGAPEGVVLIGDEAHAVKNTKAERTVKFRALAAAIRAKKGRTWLITATPLLNRPQELWSIFSAAGIAQEAFGSFKQFLETFDGKPAYWGGFDWGTPRAEAAERMRRVCLRRLKRDVMKDLPEKTYRNITVDVDRKTLAQCEKIVEQYGGIEKLVHLIENEGLKFETMSAVRNALAIAKMAPTLEMIEDFEEQEEPVIVFSAHRALIETLQKRPGWAAIMGGISANERTRIEESFQAGELKGVACTIQAGGVAITLTRATNAIFSDLEWTPALNAQAEDRIHRIGQKRGVVITVLQANHELDERITDVLMRKRQLIAASVDEAITVDAPQLGPAEIEAEYEQIVKAAEEEVALALAPKPEEPKQGSTPKFRVPASAQEEWAARAIQMLADCDPDRAAEENGVGFNKLDGDLGHSLARFLSEKGGLTNAQWKLAVKLCRKYHRQVGQCPGEVAA
jgi:SNF2 family DNA or RNA helicase